ncbi:hypothetical protein CPT_Seuss17 [Caulobacter phage Seuss]|uniref:Uncharacterized protein n=1 Tax=Caulobacter phage Seuss TaxID=1675601 RepID=A0A0K1LMW2_9CAUD|nr:hypothetical protein HOR08_gp017 [Caulobacter phage Seuss]AKU43543.1 hypothetical protein CPT_Seuss17 [Caulobacter phage Seuss]
MKVRVGRVQLGSDLSAVEKQIAGELVANSIDKAQEISPRFLRRLGARIQMAAMSEANDIFDVVVGIIDSPKFSTSDMGVRYADVIRGAPAGTSGPGGRVSWSDLSLRYAGYKRRHRPANRDRMFRYNNGLRNYLDRQGLSIVKSRLGGIQVKVDVTPPANSEVRKYKTGQIWRQTIFPEEVASLALGRVSVTMFPRLSPSLAPMLSSRKWTDSGTGKLERQLFAGTRAADKLVNRNRPYRPLVTPVLQFFMLVRIPSAIKRSVRNYLGRTGIARD